MNTIWGERFDWRVMVITDDGAEISLWRCNSRAHSLRACARIQDAIMEGRSQYTAAWIMNINEGNK